MSRSSWASLRAEQALSRLAVSYRSVCPGTSPLWPVTPGRDHCSPHLAEADAGVVRARGRRRDHHFVAVLQERALLPVRELQRLAAAPGQLQQRAALVALRAAHRAR